MGYDEKTVDHTNPGKNAQSCSGEEYCVISEKGRYKLRPWSQNTLAVRVPMY
jgi:hypothetical protein